MAGINAGAGTGPNANFFDFAEGPVPSRRFLVAADGEVAAVGEEAPEPFEGTEAEIAEPQTAQADLQDEDSEGCERGEDQSERGAEAEAETVGNDAGGTKRNRHQTVGRKWYRTYHRPTYTGRTVPPDRCRPSPWLPDPLGSGKSTGQTPGS